MSSMEADLIARLPVLFCRHVGECLAVREREGEAVAWLAADAEASFMDEAVVMAAQQGEVVDVGGAAVGPVLDVVGVGVAVVAAGEAAAAVTNSAALMCAASLLEASAAPIGARRFALRTAPAPPRAPGADRAWPSRPADEVGLYTIA